MRLLPLPFLFFLGLGVMGAEATDPLIGFHFKRSTLTIVSENDKYFAGTDRHYTNGFKLTWLGETDLNQSRQFIQLAARLIPWMDPEHVDWRYKVGATLGQNSYTPSNTDTPALIPTDRPYASWLYGSILLHAQRDNQLRLVEISAGVVGPSALGEFTQNAWHDVINVPHANGWGNQLRDEPGLQLSWERRYRQWAWKTGPGLVPDVDVILRHRVTLGNISTHLAGGFVVRLGWQAPEDFGPDLIRPGGGNMANDALPARFGGYFYASTEARLVGRDIFLDGNTWKDSHSVPKRELVADLNVGFVLHWPSFQIAYTQNYRTKEFYGQLRRDVFGSLGFSLAR
ncbi:MAG TPA: lipid A deacylase LpxR family protein [Lacunisphaera sp.]|nr:lipid A deacylase LpxR family protein [Lacunisphaera sp.]